MLKLLFNESKNAVLARFPNTEVAPRLLTLSDSAARASIITGAVFLVHRHCGVLPQPLDCICDISDALDAHAVTLGSGRDEHRLKYLGSKGFLEGRLQGTQVLGTSAAALSNNRLRKRFQRFIQGAHTRE